mmetsp:Transcript_13624/g.18035  ORF Transcript_13624/g.18035 Transcript_13624/m.18035 type:complete len:96 (+) Transcript_13624:212-499(+)
MEDLDDKLRFAMYKACEHFVSQGQKKRKLDDIEEKMEWYHGASRTGKSRNSRQETPDAYLKMCTNGGMDITDAVLTEDFDGLAHFVKPSYKNMGG